MGHKIEELTAEGIKKKLDEVREKEELKFRVFISNSFPALSDSPTIFSRMCLYCDSLDGDFLIDHDPDHPGLFVVGSRRHTSTQHSPTPTIINRQVETQVTDSSLAQYWAP